MSNDYINYAIQTIIDDLNKRRKSEGISNRSFKITDKVQTRIKDLMAKGYSVADFKRVHRVKIIEWKGTRMEKHLNPGTLYRKSHFDNYLNQPLSKEEIKTILYKKLKTVIDSDYPETPRHIIQDMYHRICNGVDMAVADEDFDVKSWTDKEIVKYEF
jgi:uncharacterized phage protein (TIGR02220 family)